jgi:DNA repair protein RecO (recombination protein O)
MQRAGRAIILKRVAFGEADWIVTFMSRDEGRLAGIAKSARASKRRFAGALEPGSIVDLRYAERSSSPLVRLEEATIAVPVHGITRTLARIGAMARSLALALAFLPERESNPEKFDLLERRLVRLAEADPMPSEGAAFELEWLARCGFAPQLASCTVCGCKAGPEGRWSFDCDRGGIVCGACGSHGVRVGLSAAARAGLRSVATKGALCDEGQATAVAAVFSTYIDHILGRPLAVR